MLDIYTALVGRVASSCGLTHSAFFGMIPGHSWGVKARPGVVAIAVGDLHDIAVKEFDAGTCDMGPPGWVV